MDKQEIKQFKKYLSADDWYKYTDEQIKELDWWINHLAFRFYLVWQAFKKLVKPLVDKLILLINN